MLRTDFTPLDKDDEEAMERCIRAMEDGSAAAKKGLDRIRAMERKGAAA